MNELLEDVSIESYCEHEQEYEYGHEQARCILSGEHPRITNVISMLPSPILTLSSVTDIPASVRLVSPLADNYITPGWNPLSNAPPSSTFSSAIPVADPPYV